MKYKIGDKAWYAKRKCEQKLIKCPDCFGQRFLTVIKGDLSQVTIDCAGCASGYDPPRGYVTYSAHIMDVSEITIDRIEETASYVEYGFDRCYRVKGTELFNTKEDAEQRALELAEKHDQEELDKIHRKEKDNHTWAWNVSYHRKQVKYHQTQLDYHSAKLNVVKAKVKG